MLVSPGSTTDPGDAVRATLRARISVHADSDPELDRLFPVLYEELRRMARARLAHERPGHTLDSVGLVNEAYLKLRKQEDVEWENPAHFRAIAARAMRTILVDYARARNTAKRGSGRPVVSLHRLPGLPSPETPDRLLALDQALHRLADVNEEACRTVECRYFLGLTLEEVSEVHGHSLATTRRRWAFAKAWLRRELGNA